MIGGIHLLVGLAMLVQAAPAQATPQARSSISGIVLHSGTGDPVPGVRVTLARSAATPESASAFLGQMAAGSDGLPAEVELPAQFLEKLRGAFPTGPETTTAPEAAFFSSAPAEGAQSILMSPDGRVSVIPKGAPPVVTDGGGRFVFRDLEPGAYRLIFAANGFVRQDYGQRVGGGRGAPIVLAAGQEMAGVVMRLTPTGAISGHITDTAGQPVAAAPVQLARVGYDATARKRVKTVLSTETDDRGEYRFYFLTPGAYYVSAGGGSIWNPDFPSFATGGGGVFATDLLTPSPVDPPFLTAPPGIANRSLQNFTLTFYPGVPDVASAAAIGVTAGSDLAGIDFSVTPQRDHTVRGLVIDDASGRPPQSAFISVVAEDETVGGAPDHQSYNPADGTFEVRNVPPGSYTLMADLPDWSPGFLPELDEAALQAMSPAERQRYFQTMEAAAINAEAERPRGVTVVTVGGEDVDGVVLRVARGASITGRIRVDGQAPGRAPAFGALRIALISRAPQLEWQPQQAIRPDGVFRIDSVPTAEYRLRVEGLPPGFYVKSARFGDVDALSASLRLPAEKPSALEIVLGSGVGQIEGTVTASTGRTVPGAAVVLIPDAGRSRPELFRMVTTGPGGEFRMSNIPPGNYHVVSWEFLDAYEYFDPALIQQAGQQGKAINVGSSSKQTVDLRAFAR